jgi:hypothetical protein
VNKDRIMNGISKIVTAIMIASFGVFIYFGILKAVDRQTSNFKKELLLKQEVVCPTLMSIGRTSRDTLITMRVEPICIDYVLKNIK